MRQTKKRKRSPTPVDRIISDDEAERRKQELRIANRTDAEDEDFRLSHGKRRR